MITSTGRFYRKAAGWFPGQGGLRRSDITSLIEQLILGCSSLERHTVGNVFADFLARGGAVGVLVVSSRKCPALAPTARMPLVLDGVRPYLLRWYSGRTL
jgi:hypothetical protein